MTTEAQSEGLLPCPFCGKLPRTCPDTSYGAATVFCPDDNECPVCPIADADLREGETLDDAIHRWNTRAALSQAQRPVSEDEVEAAGKALYDHWRTNEDFANDYCDWSLLADKQTWLDRARAAIAALATQDSTNG